MALSLLAGAATATALAVLRSELWWSLGLAVGLLVALLGFAWPEAVRTPFRIWNKLARAYQRLLRVVTMRLCYYLVFGLAGSSGAGLRLDRDPTRPLSLWEPKADSRKASYRHQFVSGRGSSSSRAWYHDYASWAMQTGNWWALSLLPWLMLLAALETDKKSHFPANIYTLF